MKTNALIIASALYATFVFRFRVVLRDVWYAAGATILALIPIGAINWLLGGNYFFIAHNTK